MAQELLYPDNGRAWLRLVSCAGQSRALLAAQTFGYGNSQDWFLYEVRIRGVRLWGWTHGGKAETALKLRSDVSKTPALRGTVMPRQQFCFYDSQPSGSFGKPHGGSDRPGITLSFNFFIRPCSSRGLDAQSKC